MWYYQIGDFLFAEWLRAEGIAPPLPPPPPPSPPPENRPEPPKKRNRKQVGNERNNNDDNDSALSSVTVKRRPSPIGDGLDSDLDTNSLSPEEEAEYRRLQVNKALFSKFTLSLIPNFQGQVKSFEEIKT